MIDIQAMDNPQTTSFSDDISQTSNAKLETLNVKVGELSPEEMEYELAEFAAILNEAEDNRKTRKKDQVTEQVVYADMEEMENFQGLTKNVQTAVNEKIQERKQQLMNKGMSEEDADKQIDKEFGKILSHLRTIQARLLSISQNTLLDVSILMGSTGSTLKEAPASGANDPALVPPSSEGASSLSEDDHINLFMLPALITVVFEMMMEVLKQKGLNKDLERELKVQGMEEVYAYAKQAAQFALAQGKAEAAKLMIQAIGQFVSAGISLGLAGMTLGATAKAREEVDQQVNSLKSNRDMYVQKKFLPGKRDAGVDDSNTNLLRTDRVVNHKGEALEFKVVKQGTTEQKGAWVNMRTGKEDQPMLKLGDGYSYNADGKIVHKYKDANDVEHEEILVQQTKDETIDGEVRSREQMEWKNEDGKVRDPLPDNHWLKADEKTFLEMKPGVAEMEMWKNGPRGSDTEVVEGKNIVVGEKMDKQIEANNKEYKEKSGFMAKSQEVHQRTYATTTMMHALQQSLPQFAQGMSSMLSISAELARAQAQAGQTMAQAVKELYQQYMQSAGQAFDQETQQIEAINQFLQQFSQNTTRLVFKG